MFQFLFRYPIPVFTKGHFVLLGAWPVWLLVALVVGMAGGLALLMRWRMGWRLDGAAPKLRGWRAWVLWAMQSAVVALLLLLLWQPAMRVAELSSRQNIIAVVVDDSRSMATADSGAGTREAAAVTALEGGVLAGLQKRFQTRLYRLGGGLTPMDTLKGIVPAEHATHLGDNLKKLAADTSDLPVGAVVLLSDGGENVLGMGGETVGLDALQALRNRRLPVHTIGFGREEPTHDVELEDAGVPANAVANARLTATVSFTQHGFASKKAMLTVRDGDKMLAAHEVTLGPDGVIRTEALSFSAGAAGAKNLKYGIEPLSGEDNVLNNSLSRPMLVSDAKRKILYVEGEPRWEFKFIRRAEDDDPTVQVVSMLRTSENKIYRQGISSPEELADGFPVKAEDLFGYAGIIIGSVDADYFTPLQQELLRESVDRRGGGILFLGGRSSLSDGGWGASSLNDLLPTFLPAGRGNFHRNSATVELTADGVESPITRLLDDPAKNAERWKKLTYLADYEDAGSPKPGATVLADLDVGHRRLPLLVTESYGHGRTAVMATGGTWRWQMSEALGDRSHDLFWQQLLRWLIAETPGPVTVSMPARTLLDEGAVQLTAQVRDRQFQPAQQAHVTAHIVGPNGVNALLEMAPSQETPGTYQAAWTAEKPGPYLVEVTAEGNASDAGGAAQASSPGPQASSSGLQALGSDVLTFQREDGVAENFHTEQNRRLLEELAAQTGGRYWEPADLKDLPTDISYSEAGISVRTTKELWDLPIVFLALLGLAAGEWLLRRAWGVV
jgi:uncharacterized membrane protein